MLFDDRLGELCAQRDIAYVAGMASATSAQAFEMAVTQLDQATTGRHLNLRSPEPGAVRALRTAPRVAGRP